MKLTQTTLTVLAAMSKVNPHIVIQPGNHLQTVNEFGTRVVQATVPDEFPVEVALHNLPEFLNVIKMFNEPEFEFAEDFVVISDDSGAQQVYYYSDKDKLVYRDKKPKELPSDIEFSITSEEFKRVKQSCSVNGVEDICFVGSDQGIKFLSHDKENADREFSINLDSGEYPDFKAYLKESKKNKLVMMDIDYNVAISKLGAVKFSAKIEDLEIEYVVALELDSEFNGVA